MGGDACAANLLLGVVEILRLAVRALQAAGRLPLPRLPIGVAGIVALLLAQMAERISRDSLCWPG
ncbi:hypothetical protein [Thauera sp.]|uniref:hypothetical protein n=1 Tax=Thauera sp. TaxID=1905334 RepID=UPI0039E29D16